MCRFFTKIPAARRMVINIPKDWLPTSDNINALPDPLRSWVHDLETICDPSGMVRDNVLIADENAQLRALIKELKS